MRRRKQGKLKLRKLTFKAKNGYYPIHKKPAKFNYYGRNISNKWYDMKDSIRQIKDGDVLFDIAQNHEDPSYRVVALWNSNLKDDAKLFYIANECKGYVLRSTAVSKIRDEDMLISLIGNHYDWHVRYAAVRNPNMSNERIFEQVALHDEDYMVRREAINHVENQDLLVYSLKNDEDPIVRINALNRIKNRDLIIFAAKKDPSWRVREVAIKLMDYNEVFEKLGIEKYCENRIWDDASEENPVDIARCDESYGERMKAVGRITNQKILFDIAVHDSHFDVISAAIYKLNSKNALKEISDNIIFYSGFFFRTSIKEIADSRLRKINELSRFKQLKLLEES